MLPLVSKTKPMEMGASSEENCVICCSTLSSKSLKCSFSRPVTKRFSGSVTVTLMSTRVLFTLIFDGRDSTTGSLLFFLVSMVTGTWGGGTTAGFGSSFGPSLAGPSESGPSARRMGRQRPATRTRTEKITGKGLQTPQAILPAARDGESVSRWGRGRMRLVRPFSPIITSARGLWIRRNLLTTSPGGSHRSYASNGSFVSSMTGEVRSLKKWSDVKKRVESVLHAILDRAYEDPGYNPRTIRLLSIPWKISRPTRR